MSIASTVTSLERANAAYKAAQAAATPVARRGMFALVEREHRYSYLCGAHFNMVDGFYHESILFPNKSCVSS